MAYCSEAGTQAINTFFRKVFARFLKAHKAKGRRDVCLDYLLGGQRLMEEPLAEFCTPGFLHAALEAQYTEVPPLLVRESSLAQSTRKTRAWMSLNNDRNSSRNDKDFTNSIWYQLQVFMTNSRRTGHGLTDLDPVDFCRPESVSLIAPYYDASGDKSDDDFSMAAVRKKRKTPVEQILAQETAPDVNTVSRSARGPDPHVEDSDPESLLADIH